MWRATHKELPHPVAVKLLTVQSATPKFRAEVRAFAALDHPNIVRLYDYGVVSRRDAAAGEGVLRPNLPYMVMELVMGRSLAELAPELDWVSLRNALLSLLDALAHAHARGVIHRDLMPHNVMVAAEHVKLTDFGIALATGTGSTSRVTRREDTAGSGTPHYMAPEQITGLWQDQGPWTDLYALGCLTWALACGAPPFDADTVMGVLIAQVNSALPPFKPRIPVPDDFQPWLRRLLEKGPERRFLRAADAAWALLSLEEPLPDGDDPGDTLPEAPRRSHETIRIPDALRAINWTSMDRLKLALQSTTEELGIVRPGIHPGGAPPPPSDWRGTSIRAPRGALRGGLRLFGLRSLPIVGRLAERDALWGALHRVHDEARPLLVTVHGEAGIGKSRLVEWLAERAHELGAATLLRAEHGPVPGDGDGLRAMLRRHFRCEELEPPLLMERIDRFLGSFRVSSETARERLAALLRGGDDDGDGIRLGGPRERHAVLRHVVELLAIERTVILWLDNVQWGHDALEFAEQLLADAPQQRVLVVVTYTDGALAEAPAEHAQVAALAAREHALDLPLAPLDEEDRRVLLREVLRLSPPLAAQVEARAGGNPMFVVQLVADWVQRDLLEPGGDGLRLAAGADTKLPDSLYEVWSARVEGLLEERPEADGIALELAAVLGRQVEPEEWAAACRAAGVSAPNSLVGELLKEGLVSALVGQDLRFGWRFADGLLGETLRRRAAGSGRLQAAHRAVVTMLRARGGNARRLGEHLVGAGDGAAAVGPLLQAARECSESGELRVAERLLALREDTLGPGDARERAEGTLVRAELALARGDWTAAEEAAKAATDAAVEGGWLDVVIEALLLRARAAKLTGRLAAAWRHAEDAESWARTNLEGLLLARALQLKGQVMAARGALEAAGHCYEEALAGFADGSPLRRGECLDGLGQIALATQRLGEAEGRFAEARALFAEGGSGPREAQAIDALGEVARHRGALDEAQELYADALERLEGLGAVEAVVPRAHLALTELARGHLGSARPLLATALAEAEARGLRALLGVLHAAMLPGLLADGDTRGFDHHVQEAIHLGDETGLADPDVAGVAQQAGELARSAGDTRRARQAWLLAREHLRGLGRGEEAAALDERIGRLG